MKIDVHRDARTGQHSGRTAVCDEKSNMDVRYRCPWIGRGHMLRRWLRVDPVLALTAATALATCAVAVHVWSQRPRADATEVYYGVRLGMSPNQTLAMFRDAALGSWRWEEADKYDFAHWQRQRKSTATPRAAKFVFDDGLLTVVQFEVDKNIALARGGGAESTDFAEVTRKPTAQGVLVTVMYRCCALNDATEWKALKSRWLEGD